MQERIAAVRRGRAPRGQAQIDADRLTAEILVRHRGRDAEAAADLEESPRMIFPGRVVPHLRQEPRFVVVVIHLPDDAVEIVFQPLGRERAHDELLSPHGFTAGRMMVRRQRLDAIRMLPREFPVRRGGIGKQHRHAVSHGKPCLASLAQQDSRVDPGVFRSRRARAAYAGHLFKAERASRSRHNGQRSSGVNLDHISASLHTKGVSAVST